VTFDFILISYHGHHYARPEFYFTHPPQAIDPLHLRSNGYPDRLLSRGTDFFSPMAPARPEICQDRFLFPYRMCEIRYS
jgi:hypothetical protein